MVKHTTKNLFSDLQASLEKNPNDELSDSQRALMQQVHNHLHRSDEPEPQDLSLNETLELLLLDLEQQHPKAATLVKEILKTLENIGI
ncbi:MAG: hypothetical protein ACI9D5_001969 [Candidatus Endobugula sp.]|jgi:hypothetical protein